MPASTGPSSCSAVRPILPSPSARSVPRCFWVSPIWLRVWVTRTFAIALFCRCLVGEDLRDRQAAHLRHLVRSAKALEAVHGRLRHVDRVRRAKALGEDVADPGPLDPSELGPRAQNFSPPSRAASASALTRPW